VGVIPVVLGTRQVIMLSDVKDVGLFFLKAEITLFFMIKTISTGGISGLPKKGKDI